MRHFAVSCLAGRMRASRKGTGRSRVVSDQPPERLDSWKDIAAYLKRDVSTVQRWEKREGMPVHRHQHDKMGSVYAFAAELDAWARSRRASSEPQTPEVAGDPTAGAPTPARKRRIFWLAAGAIAVIALVVPVAWNLSKPAQNPLANAQFARLTDFDGTEQAAAISRDGRFAAFLSDRDGPADVWVTQIGTGQFHNLTRGKVHELVNRDIRTIGFSPDGALVAFWVRRQDQSGASDISIWAVPTLGGEPRRYLERAAEFDWSRVGMRLVYHTPDPGDPIFIKEAGRERKIFTATPGVHNHYPVWSPDDEFIYFVSGGAANENDIWRIRTSGGAPERMTSHKSRVSHLTFLGRDTLLYLATDPDGAGPWLYALDVNARESRRISFGVERYTSLAGDADGGRLVATVANPRRALWRVPIGNSVSHESAASRVVSIVGGRAPRVGRGYLLYVSSRPDAESIWKFADGTASELWSVTGGRIIGGPAIAPDGKHVAFTVEERGRTRIYLMNADGSGVRAMPETLQPRGAPAWSPDSRSIAVPLLIDRAPRLGMVSVAEATWKTVASEFAADPVWSPDGSIIVYSGSEAGTTFPIRAVRADGGAQPATKITLSRGARRVAFLPREKSLVVLRGEMVHKNFWAISLDTGRERRLTDLGSDFIIGDFDISPDGREIVFEREQDNSDIVLIER